MTGPDRRDAALCLVLCLGSFLGLAAALLAVSAALHGW